MPIFLPPADAPITRRSALGILAAGALAATSRPGRPARAEGPGGPWFALLSDTHVAADPAASARGQVMAENLRAVVADVLAAGSRPEAVLVDGDLALGEGRPGDYRTFLDLVAPLREAGLPLHLTLGNHDDRDNFRRAVAPEAAEAGGKHVGAFEAAGLRFLLLDSLDAVNATPGRLGPEQLAWLAGQLDERPGSPALVFVHHNPLPDSPSALLDTEALLDVLRPRRQAKAVVFGHTHVWNVRRDDDGLYRVNLPAVAYPFTPIQPLGWVRLTPADGGASLELRCVGGNRKDDRQAIGLRWRDA